MQLETRSYTEFLPDDLFKGFSLKGRDEAITVRLIVVGKTVETGETGSGCVEWQVLVRVSSEADLSGFTA
jgi:hypothetical protein